VECALKALVAAKRPTALSRIRQYLTSLSGQCSRRGARRYTPPLRCLAGDAPHRAASDARHGLNQMTGPRISVQHPGHFADSVGEPRAGFRKGLSHPGQMLHRVRRKRLGRNRQEFAGRHPNQRKELLGGFLFRFRLECPLSQVFHHGVGIDLADGTYFLLRFGFESTLAFVFLLAFAEQAADYVADGAKPAFSFEARLTFILAFHFLFTFSRVFIFQFLHHFALGLISHDNSSSKSARLIARGDVKSAA
jgi:hypothetical protein